MFYSRFKTYMFGHKPELQSKILNIRNKKKIIGTTKNIFVSVSNKAILEMNIVFLKTTPENLQKTIPFRFYFEIHCSGTQKISLSHIVEKYIYLYCLLQTNISKKIQIQGISVFVYEPESTLWVVEAHKYYAFVKNSQAHEEYKKNIQKKNCIGGVLFKKRI